MKEIYKYIEIYDEIISTIKNYQSKKQDGQILFISIINNTKNVLVDIGLEDKQSKNKDIRTKVLDLGFNKYVLPRIAIRYNNWYQTSDERMTKNDMLFNYINVSTSGDEMQLLNYPLDIIDNIRCLID